MAPRRTFTVKEKVEIISKWKNGANNADLCKEYKVSHSTISTMWKNRDKILECFVSKSLKIKKNRKPTHRDVEKALLVWFKAQRSQNVPVSGPLLQEKANFARLFGKIDFKCSESWTARYCSRQREKCVGGKLSKDRITVLVASSMAGEKRKLLVIGKAKKPWCFKNVKFLPVDYEANRKAWMTPDIFEKVLRKWDSRLRNNKKKIILFIDNCPAHPKIENLTNIKLAFLPPNTTSVIQPIDQGIIKTLKSHYRKILVQKMMNDIEKAAGSFSVNLLNAIEMTTTAWARVTPETIKKCFLHAGFRKSSVITTIDDDSDDELDIPLAQLTASSSGTYVPDWETYVNIDSQLITTSNLTDIEIVETVASSPTTQDEENEEEEEDDKEVAFE
ncbi:tigger transposable element-derived protein 4-like [Danaus plexippus]|uniref:tigger transposable element-derived protein 4-like n=1 Tax=Danaus plexippus TaxID=13037 RepID=UPI002AB08F16|nr:tigger transposable element-derived protein 4-like [Danaus plexippus]